MAGLTTTVEIDTALMERLRARHPGMDDRTILEGLARISIGFKTLPATQTSNEVPDEVAAAEALGAPYGQYAAHPLKSSRGAHRVAVAA